jgi:hypothetical protein
MYALSTSIHTEKEGTFGGPLNRKSHNIGIEKENTVRDALLYFGKIEIRVVTGRISNETKMIWAKM